MAMVHRRSRYVNRENTKLGRSLAASRSLPPLEMTDWAESELADRLPKLSVVILEGSDIPPTVVFCGPPELCDTWAQKWEADDIEGEWPRPAVIPVEYHIAGRIVAGGKVGAA